MADHRGGLAEDLGLRDPALGADVGRQRAQRLGVGGVADRHDDADRQAGERVERGAVQRGEEAHRRRDGPEGHVDERRRVRVRRGVRPRAGVVEAQHALGQRPAGRLERGGREREVGRGGEALAGRVGLEAGPGAQLVEHRRGDADGERLGEREADADPRVRMSRASAATAPANSQLSRSTTSGRHASMAISIPDSAARARTPPKIWPSTISFASSGSAARAASQCGSRWRSSGSAKLRYASPARSTRARAETGAAISTW